MTATNPITTANMVMPDGFNWLAIPIKAPVNISQWAAQFRCAAVQIVRIARAAGSAMNASALAVNPSIAGEPMTMAKITVARAATRGPNQPEASLQTAHMVPNP